MGKMKLAAVLAAFIIGSLPVFAHCPLCTVGVAFVAGGAAIFGVHRMVIGVFVGAFAASTGLWLGRLIKKKLIPLQKTAIFFASCLLTILPLWPLLKDSHPLMLNFAGDYGSLLNRTYLIDYYIIGSIIGAFIVFIAPFLSKRITSARKGKHAPFQGIILTLVLLVITGVILQLMLHYGVIK